ncbi:MAG: hypothetical protein Q7T34_02895 [Candidatus Parcubacteria bacterium]|nr:hypothetical protein [Candidatus Parcubacteria bacterium]
MNERIKRIAIIGTVAVMGMLFIVANISANAEMKTNNQRPLQITDEFTVTVATAPLEITKMGVCCDFLAPGETGVAYYLIKDNTGPGFPRFTEPYAIDVRYQILVIGSIDTKIIVSLSDIKFPDRPAQNLFSPEGSILIQPGQQMLIEFKYTILPGAPAGTKVPFVVNFAELNWYKPLG